MIWCLKYINKILLIILIPVLGCSAHRTPVIDLEPRPLGKDYETFKTPVTGSLVEAESRWEDDSEVLTLEQAISLALLNNPELATFSYEIRAAEKRALQAGLYPNPELEVELEDFAGSGDLRGFRSSETTALLSHSLLLAGKRSKEKRAATLEADLAAWDYESKRLDVITKVRKVYTQVLADRQKVDLTRELVKLSEQLVASIREQVKAGKVSPAELSRAEVGLATTQVELTRARNELETSRLNLATLWGSQKADYGQPVGTLDTLRIIPPLEKLEPLLLQNPDIARFEKELEQRQSVIALEDAKRVPDPVLSGGLRRINESDDHSFVLSLSVPLPLTDRNQGARQEARMELEKTLRERDAAKVQLNAELFRTHNQLKGAYLEATTLRDHIVLEAQKAFDVIREGHMMGRFDFLDVLDAQRTLFEAREQHLLALNEYHHTMAEIERLIAQEIIK
jgi:cobalt-zinc-cadmium efflux system outer membrane protein